MKLTAQQLKIGSVMVVAEQSEAPPTAGDLVFPLAVALLGIWWALQDGPALKQEASKVDEDSETMRRARDVRGQMDYLMDLLEEGEPDRGTLNQAREILEGMTRLVAAMEEGR